VNFRAKSHLLTAEDTFRVPSRHRDPWYLDP
jgi:hypothetical protein